MIKTITCRLFYVGQLISKSTIKIQSAYHYPNFICPSPVKNQRITLRASFWSSSIKNQQKLLQIYQNIKKKQIKQTPISQNEVISIAEQQQLLPQHQSSSSSLSNINMNMNTNGSKPELNIPQIKCQSCNVKLQSKDKSKYGFINQKILKEIVQQNSQQVKEKYGGKAKDRDAKILDLLHEVQKQSGIVIFDPKSSELQNMDNVEVLMRLEQKIDKYEEQEQLLVRSKTNRKQVICFRCFSLKHHNRLPEQYDHNLDFTSSSTDFILNKMLNRHKSTKNTTQFLFLVDALDILGTFQQWLFQKLVKQGLYVTIVVNKVDVIHREYIHENSLRDAIKKKLRQYLVEIYVSASEVQKKLKQIQIFFISCNSRDGIKKLTQHIEGNKKNIQLVGYPNTGKTTLLNVLAKMKKLTSKVPGTTVKISEYQYRNTKRRIYDMPGLFSQNLLYNLVTKPSIKSMLIWHKKIAPGLLTNHAFIYGGKIEIPDTRIIIFGLGGACQSTNRWFIDNRREFWKGLPDPQDLQIVKYQEELEFFDGKTKDLQIAGYGFIGFRLSIPNVKYAKRTLTLYLPKKVSFEFRDSVLSVNESVFHNRSAIKKRFMLERLTLQNKNSMQTKQNMKNKAEQKQPINEISQINKAKQDDEENLTKQQQKKDSQF